MARPNVSRRAVLAGALATVGAAACTSTSSGAAAGGGRLLLRGPALPGGQRADVLLDQGKIAAIGGAAADAEEVDLNGYLLLPSGVEAHAHLDKAFLARRVPNPTGDLQGAIEVMPALAPTMTDEDVRDRASRGIELAVRHGYTAIRTHVDTTESSGTRALAVMLDLRQRYADIADIQVVAFAGTISGVAGAPARALLDEGLRMGADVVGGLPYADPDPAAAVREYLAAAREYDRMVDLHTDETTDPSVLSLRELIAETARTGMGGRVAASHCVSLGQQDPGTAELIAKQAAGAGVAVITLPQTNLYLQGRDSGTRVPRALTAIDALRRAGAVLAAGGDNWRDPFNAVGRADPFEIAALLVAAGHLDIPAAYAAVSDQARAVLNLPPVTLRPGDPAELLAIRATDLDEAVAGATEDRVVIHQGRLVARTQVTTTLTRAS
ncbi:amidohydrolase family protein [Saccharopolyspora indica]|uniref:amidohydrolase family protein n=1 Tax=Saccharopolyspora indica TaxID=1229659 RepID=UPI0022EB3FFD|nr:amidohydrolase family protein [Saccharopolyspora indica]MDA3647935.1 amidohydrolase family protein [Saccharopolyspora indica]